VANKNIKRKEQTVEANQSLIVAYIRPGLRRDDQYLDTISGNYIHYPRSTVCHHAIAIEPCPCTATDPTTPLYRSCLDLTRLMADLTHHYSEWVLIMSFKHVNITVIRDHVDFRDAGKERRRHPQTTSHKLRSEYDRSVRHHQEHDDPALT
jgi:hypothetical protein